MDKSKSGKKSRYKNFFNYSKNNFRKNWLLSIFFSIFSIFSILLLLFLWQLNKKFDTPIYNFPNQQITIVKKNGHAFKNEEIKEIENLKSVTSVSKGESILEFGGFSNSDSFGFNSSPTWIKSVDINSFSKNNMKNYVNFQGRFLEKDNEIIVSQDFANLKDVKIGDTIEYKYKIPDVLANQDPIIHSEKFKIVGTVGYINTSSDFHILISNNGYKNLVKNIFNFSKKFLIQDKTGENNETDFAKFLIQNLSLYGIKKEISKNSQFPKITEYKQFNFIKNFSLDNNVKTPKSGKIPAKNNEILVNQKLIDLFKQKLNLNLNIGDEINFKLQNPKFLFFNDQLFTFKISGIFDSDEASQILFNKNVVQVFDNALDDNLPFKLDIFHNPGENPAQNLLSKLEKKGYEPIKKLKYETHVGVAEIWSVILGVLIMIILLISSFFAYGFGLKQLKINNLIIDGFSANENKKMVIKKINSYWFFILTLVFLTSFLLFFLSTQLPFFNHYLENRPKNYIIGRISLDLFWISLVYLTFSTIIFEATVYFKYWKNFVKIKNVASTKRL